MKSKLTVFAVVLAGAALCLGALNTEVAVLREIYHQLNGGLPAALAAGGGLKIEGVAGGVPVPVSAASLPLPTGAAKDSSVDGLEGGLGTATTAAVDGDANGSVVAHVRGINKKLAAGVGVTGTFWQTTQPVSIASMPSTPVTGTFWQATQPVSGTFWQATQPVSGTFWQATQPVSIASMPSTPVTGTFWQATQPVSGTVTATGTFWQATQPVSIASMPSTPVTGTFWQATQPVSASALPLPTGAATETSVAAKVCGVAMTTVTKNAWTAIPAGGQTYMVVNASSVTSGNTATLTIWGSPDGGTTQRVLLRADTLAPAKAVSVAVGTAAGPDTTTFADAFAVTRAGCTHIYIQQTAAGTDNYAYSVAGF